MVPAVALVLVTAVVTVLCRRLLEEAAQAEVELPTLLPLFVALMIFMVSACGALFVQAFRLSHRVAGPAYRICQSLKQIRNGDTGFRVHLRKNDFLFEVADELNTLLDTMAERQPAVAAALPADGSRSSEPPDGWYAMEPTSEEAGTSSRA
jgi:hypothetical protein